MGFSELESLNLMTDPLGLYTLLKVPLTADRAAIKKSYWAKAKRAHPDKAGGNAGRFAELSRAYRVLGNADLRTRYDETGAVDEKEVLSTYAEVAMILIGVFRQILSQAGGQAEKVDFMALMKSNAKEMIANYQKQEAELDLKITTLEKLRKQIHREGDGRNLFVIEIDALLTTHCGKLIEIKRQAGIAEAAIEELSLYKSEVEMVRHVSVHQAYGTTTSTSSWGLR